jgi:Icc-related predicted phosphoesterase
MGDVLIHCGDISNVGEQEQVEDFINWLKEQPHRHKVFVAGNHDRSFDPTKNEFDPTSRPSWLTQLLESLQGSSIHYLENSGVEIDGIKFWGSPWTPSFFPDYWAFNAERGDVIKKHWDLIPIDTDVVITHGPPHGRLDLTKSGKYVGCADLRCAIEVIKPKYHLFGHIHEGHGIEEDYDTTYVNASLLNHRYTMVNSPIIINL